MANNSVEIPLEWEPTSPEEVETLVRQAAAKHGVDPDHLVAMARTESSLNPAVQPSPKGAIGVMQLMPGTAKELGVNPHNIAENIDGGARYFKGLMDRFGGDVSKATAAYNAGPGAVESGRPLPEETRNYQKSVLGDSPDQATEIQMDWEDEKPAIDYDALAQKHGAVQSIKPTPGKPMLGMPVRSLDDYTRGVDPFATARRRGEARGVAAITPGASSSLQSTAPRTPQEIIDRNFPHKSNTPLPPGRGTIAPQEPGFLESLVAPIREGAVGEALGIDSRTAEAKREDPSQPLLRFDAAVPGSQPGVARSVAQFVSGLTTPENLSIMAATGGIGAFETALGKTAMSKLISAGFSSQMLYDAVKQSPEFAKQVEAGDWAAARGTLTNIILSTALSAQGFRHALSNTPHPAPEPSAPPAELSRRGQRFASELGVEPPQEPLSPGRKVLSAFGIDAAEAPKIEPQPVRPPLPSKLAEPPAERPTEPPAPSADLGAALAEQPEHAGPEWWAEQPETRAEVEARYAQLFDEAEKRNATRDRRAAQEEPEIPETGTPEEVARVQDARQRMAKQMVGRNWEDLNNSERIAIDGLIQEGWGKSVEPMATETGTEAPGMPATGAAEPQVASEAPQAPETTGKPKFSLPGFYSQLERAAGDIRQERMTSQQALAMLKKAGVKQEELDWTGTEEWLKGRPSVSKQELLDHIRGHQVEIKEVPLSPDVREAERSLAGLRDDVNSKGATLGYKARRSGMSQLDAANLPGRVIDGRISVDSLPEGLREDARALLESNAAMMAAKEKLASGGGPTKYDSYTLPGGKNYREILFTLPTRQAGELPKDWRVEPPGKDSNLYRAFNSNGELLAYGESHADAINQALNDTSIKPGVESYRSPHWKDTPNVLAHARVTDRVTPDGKRVLFVEEIQSDWGQEGRKKGYASEVEKSLTPEERELRDLNAKSWDGTPLTKAEADRAEELRQKVQGSLIGKVTKPTVPDMPFPKSWHEFVFKNLLRKAAEDGYDQIAWTTGEQQSSRYDLSKQVDKIGVVKVGDDNYTVRAFKDGDQLIQEHNLTPDKLASVIGKDLAKKAVDQIATQERTQSPRKFANFTGPDLKVGGEGMKGFYDKILPDFANKYAKKWGGKVGSIDLTFGQGDKRALDTILRQDFGTDWSSATEEQRQQAIAIQSGAGGSQTTAVHSLDLTPAMRESVKAGQPLFTLSPADAPITPADISNAFGKRPVVKVGDEYHVTAANGVKVRVLTDRTIELTAEEAAEATKAYKREIAPGTKAAGYYARRIDGDGMIALAREGGGLGALRHETFHAAMDLALTKKEKAAILKVYGDEESAARAYEEWAPGREEPSGFFGKIAEYFRNLYRNLRPTADSVMGKISAGEVWERRKVYTDKTAITPNFSLGTYDNWEQKFRAQAKERGMKDADIERNLRGAALSRALFAAKPELVPLDHAGNPLRTNTDFGFSLDFDTICSRAQDFYATVDAIQKETGQVINGDEWTSLSILMRDFGENTNCGYCYSAAGRGVWNEMASRITKEPFTVNIKKVPTKFPPIDPQYIIWPERGDARAATDPAFKRHLDAARSYIGGASSGLANKRKEFTPYAAQLLNRKTYTPEWVQKQNAGWGARLQSHTDFKPWHALDMLQFMTDATLIKLAAHVYTKEPWLVRIFGDTGLKMNLSMMGEWDPKAGKVVYDSVWGLDEKFVKQAHDRYANAGGMLVAMQPEVIIEGMRPENAHIGQIIPMHSSGLTKTQMEAYNWHNFTAAKDKPFTAGDAPEGFKRTAGMTDKSISREVHQDNVEKFLAAAERNGLRPRFAEFIYQLDKNGKILRDASGKPLRRWTGPGGLENTAQLMGVELTAKNRAKVFNYGRQMERGYMKLVSDFARTDTAFKPLDVSKVDVKALNQLVQDWHDTGRVATDDGVVNPDVVAAFIKHQAAGTLPKPAPLLIKANDIKPAPLFGLPERTLGGKLKPNDDRPTKATQPKKQADPESETFNQGMVDTSGRYHAATTEFPDHDAVSDKLGYKSLRSAIEKGLVRYARYGQHSPEHLFELIDTPEARSRAAGYLARLPSFGKVKIDLLDPKTKQYSGRWFERVDAALRFLRTQ